MRPNPLPLIAAFLLCSCISFAQQTLFKKDQDDRYRLALKSGSFIPQKNIIENSIDELNKNASRAAGKSYLIIQFENIPTENEKKQLHNEGIELLDYIPNNAYTATVTGSLNTATLNRVKARAVVDLAPEQKMEPSLVNGVFPAWAVKAAGTVDIWISFPKTFSYDQVSAGIKFKNFDITSTEYKTYNILALRIATNRLKELAALPFIEYVQTAPKEDEPINNKSTANTKATILRSSLAGGRNLTGEGVVIGVGDDSNPARHIDFAGRMINRAANTGGSHGLHVMGTVGGAGLRQELYIGFAPKTKIVAQRFSGILANAPVYVQDFGMVITNNSYGNIVDDCASFGVYDLYSRVLDQQAFQMPNLQQVFAAGNSGTYQCSPYLPGFSNVLGGYQTAKNTISVGNGNEFGIVSVGSSKGPVKDGRIKPEIIAQGTSVASTTPTNNYGFSSGTSMASPAVSGGLALLYQRYKQLHGNVNPKNGLMKALLCNGATDKGNAGPDFSYGFGWMNLLRSVTMLEKNNYFNTTVNTAATNAHSITIPVGSSIALLKVMLYWNDPAAAVLASNALINDLDLQVTDPAATIHLPQLLNASPVNVNDPAITGADHANNIEQVVINNPAPGTYTFSVKGTAIPVGGQQEYFLVFDTIAVSTTITYPAGGEHLRGGDLINIHWDSYGHPANDFTLQYSIDNGANWTDVINGTNVAADSSQIRWTVPAAATSQAKIKLIHNGTGIESISEAFTIIGVPVITLAPVANQCEGYIAISWAAISGATDYEVMLLQGEEMVPVATTTANSYTITGLSKDSAYWVSVRARVNGNPGRRALAVTRQPNTGTCSGTISDKDVKIDAILSPAVSGRKFTTTELSNTTSVTIRIENLDNAPTSGNIPVSYIVDSNPPVNETIIAPNIGSRLSFNYTFATPVNMSATGSYDLKVSVSYPGDPVSKNDTILKTFKQLDNPFINLATDFIDDMEAASIQSHTTPQTGLQGLDRYDFVSSTVFGQIRSFVNSGIANSGSKALTLDADRYNAGGTTDSLTATFNLLGYDKTVDDIRLDFMYNHHKQLSNAANKVWIRGDDQKPWIQAYDLYANQAEAGIYKKAQGIELSSLLDPGTQNFSSSFQVRWVQWGHMNVSDRENAAGYTFDDIRLYKVSNDLQLISIDTPESAGCGLDNAVPVKITIRNSAGTTISAIPVKYQVDNNPVVIETVSSIAGKTIIPFSFATATDLSALGSHTIKVWVDLAADTYRNNDTAVLNLYNSPVISSFPYLQNFETSDGSWHSEGKNNSWQYGTPASIKINRAASGIKAWKTTLAGNYNDLEKSYLYSPCFDVAGLVKPILSMSIAIDLEDCGTTLCDAGYMEYSEDGKTWTRLGAVSTGTNWYNKNYDSHVWSVQNYTRWHVASIPLPVNVDRLMLRFVMESDPYTSREGIAIDDIHIYDSVYSIYDGPPYTSTVSNQAAVNGNSWSDFVVGGKIIVSVNPNGQNIGSTDVQAFIDTGAVRIDSGQYYHSRNIAIKPATVNLADSAAVRFYFLDKETEKMINATGCDTCTKPTTAYELGVSKYSDVNDALENGDFADNNIGKWLFLNSDNVAIVPFDKGYYAEFRVKNFSEFWLTKSAISNGHSWPVDLISFTATKQADNNVAVKWTTASEYYTAKYEVEVAKGNEEYRLNHFVKIGEIKSNGNITTQQDYQLIDLENQKSGVRYYRLKTIDHDGSFSYSVVRPVFFTNELVWQIFPNPSSGMFYLAYQVGEGETVGGNVFDIKGKLIRQLQFNGNAFIQKAEIDLSGPQFAPGLYFLQVKAGEKKQVFRLLKQ